MNRTSTTRGVAWLRLVVGVAVIGIAVQCESLGTDSDNDDDDATGIITTWSRTTTSTTPASGPDEEERLNQLSGQVGNLQKQTDDTTSEVKKIEAAMVVAQPAASASPTTIGQHVGLAETNIAAIQKNLSDNLGISVHALVDAGYEHNFNQPNGNINTFRAWDEDGFQLTQGNLHIERDGTVGFVTDLNFGQVANSISSVTQLLERRTRRAAMVRSDAVLPDLHRAVRIGREFSSRPFRNAAGRRGHSGLQQSELQREPRPAVYPGRTADAYRRTRQLHVQRLCIGHRWSEQRLG